MRIEDNNINMIKLQDMQFKRCHLPHTNILNETAKW